MPRLYDSEQQQCCRTESGRIANSSNAAERNPVKIVNSSNAAERNPVKIASSSNAAGQNQVEQSSVNLQFIFHNLKN
jgi:hypothetical protein